MKGKFKLLLTAVVMSSACGQAISGPFLPEQGQPLTDPEITDIRSKAGAAGAGSGIAAPIGSILIDDEAWKEDTLRSIGFSASKWPNGEIFYQYHANVGAADRTTFENACQAWSAVAKVKCTPRSSQNDYVLVRSGDGNWSHIGYQGGEQIIEIAEWWRFFVVVHEIGHTLGAAHEQARSDRDNFVKVIFRNVIPGREFNFDKRVTTNLSDYDFESVMHYDDHAFSRNRQATIVAKPGYERFQDVMGQRARISALDAAAMAARYGAVSLGP